MTTLAHKYKGFANILTFPINSHAGIVVARIAAGFGQLPF